VTQLGNHSEHIGKNKTVFEIEGYIGDLTYVLTSMVGLSLGVYFRQPKQNSKKILNNRYFLIHDNQ